MHVLYNLNTDQTSIDKHLCTDITGFLSTLFSRPGGCESPVSDFEARTPKGRGKRTSRNSAAASERLPEGRRLRKGRRGTVNSSSSNFTAPPSPAKSEAGSAKRKVRGEADSSADRSGKRSRSCSRGGGAESPAPTPPASSDAYIMCPEPNCFKKYKHINGLRYHRTHAHQKSSATEDGKEDMECDEEEDDKIDKKDRTPLSERAERMKAKEKQRLKEQKRGSDRDSKDSLDDDIPLKDLANKVAKTPDTNVVGKDKENMKSLDGSSINALTANSKIDPHVVLTKTTIHLPSDSSSLQGINSYASKSKETLDVQSVSSSSSATSMPSSLQSSSTSSASCSALATSVPFNSSSSCENGSGYPPLGNNNATANGNTMPVMTTLKSPITSQVYQISPTGCLGGVTLVSAQTNPSLSLVSAQTFPLTTSASLGSVATSTSTTSSVMGMSMSATERHGKQGPPGSIGGPQTIRSVSNTRPIVPAPLPGPQGTPGSSLKAIQPKPQFSGEYPPNSTASLTDLSKDKVRKSKKKRAENKDCPSSLKGYGANGSETSSREDERANVNHVIKGPPNLPSSNNADLSHAQTVSESAFQQRLAASPSPDVVGTGAGGGLRPSFLPVTPGGGELRSTVNDDVHSPAYSDISDANDTGSPPQRDSPDKKEVGGASLTSLKKENQVNGSPHLGPDGGAPPSSLGGHFSGMYYFGGPPGYLPHGLSPQSMASPTLKKDGASVDESSMGKSDVPDKKDATRQQQRSCQSPQQIPSGASAADMQQKSFINYYAHIHGVSPAAVQYQYNLATQSPTSLDHFHQTLAAQQDPLLRQHLIDQHQKQQRLIQQQDSLNSAGSSDPSGTRNSSSAMGNSNSSLRHQGGGSSPLHKPGLGPGAGAPILDGSSEHKRFSTPDDREQALRDKQSENHQILKENIELKSQMGQHQLLMELQQQQQQMNYRMMKQQEQQHQQKSHHQQHHSDVMRAQMFQHQKQKTFDSQRSDMRKIPSELGSSGLGQQLTRLPGDLKPEDLLSNDMIKKEPRSDSRFDAVSSGGDSKRFDIKDEHSSGDTKSSRPSSQSGGGILPPPPLSSLPSSLASTPSPSPLNAGTPVPLITTLPGAPPGFPYTSYYTPSGAFRPMQLDPGHPMYRALNPHMMGYPGGGPPPGSFLTPSQLGFRLPADFDGKALAVEGKGMVPGATVSEPPLDGKNAPGAQGLGVRSTTPLHKIHELQEKGRHPSPGVNSPASLGKSSVADVGKGADSSSSSSTPGPHDKGSSFSNSGSNNNNNNGGGSGSGGSKDKQRDYASSPPPQRHVHTHHHTHVVGGFPPLYPPDAYSGKLSLV